MRVSPSICGDEVYIVNRDVADLLAENARLKSELASFQHMKYSDSEDVDCYCE